MKHMALALSLLCPGTALIADAQRTPPYPGFIQYDSPVLATMTDASSLVVHVQVTNVWQVGGNIRGTVTGSAACVIQRTLKGPHTNGTISISFELPAPVFEVGHEYVMFLKEASSPGATSYVLVDRWLASPPFNEVLINAVRGHQKHSSEARVEPGGAANRNQPIRSQTNSTSPAAGSGR